MTSAVSTSRNAGARPLSPAARARALHPRHVLRARGKSHSEADLYDPHMGIDAYQAEDTSIVDSFLSQPVYVKVPALLVGLIATTRVFGAVMRRQRRSALEERGYKRDTAADEDHYNRMMRGMKTVKYDELSDEAVAQARARRQREVAGDDLDIDNLELPSNHPFATKESVSAEEEAMQRERMMARRGLSKQDLELLKKTQEEAEPLNGE